MERTEPRPYVRVIELWYRTLYREQPTREFSSGRIQRTRAPSPAASGHGHGTDTADAVAHGQASHWIFRVTGSTGMASLVRRTTPSSLPLFHRPKKTSASVPVDHMTMTTESPVSRRQSAGRCHFARTSPGNANVAGSMRSATKSPGLPGRRATVSSRTTVVDEEGPRFESFDQAPKVRR